MVRAAVLSGIPVALRGLGVDPVLVLRLAGLADDALDDSEETISYRAAGELLKQAAQLTRCRHFGLLAGNHLSPAALGTLGVLAERSDNVRSALQALVAHLHLQTRGGVVTFEADGADASFGYAIYLLDTPGTALGYDLVMAFQFNILKSICGPFWRPTQVSFAHAKPLDVGPYQQIFNCELRFDAERSALRFGKRWLDQPTVKSDPARFLPLRRELTVLERACPQDRIDDVRRALRLRVLNGKAHESELAAVFATSPRSLHRLLAASGTSFKKLLDETRYEVARQLLMDTDLPAVELGVLLGYSEPAAFSRAFRRWTGLPPGAWRGALQSCKATVPFCRPVDAA